MNLLHCL